MQRLTRRRLLVLGGMAAAIGGESIPSEAGAPTAVEQSNVKAVADFCAAWVARDIEKLVPYLAENATYRITETSPPIVGRAAFHDRVGAIIARMTSIEFKITNTMAMGPLVLTERDDTLVSPQRTQRYHVAGMFYLVDGKIVEWTDYIIKD